MNNPRAMTTLKTLADSAERESSRTLAERRRILDDEEERLEQLRRYLSEYTATDSGRDGIFVDTIRARRDFIAQINAGIQQQENLIQGLRQQLDLDMEQWRDARSHSLALERYSDRMQAEEDEKSARREQARLDEVGRQLHFANSA